ncbi:MAG TPA: hypothetical protein VL475_00240, partial [Planctomycetaceae bacterium]|nr:hypothetical protein [Planctomycetaceae bacterium]
MSSSSRWVTGRWVWGIAVLGCAVGGTGVAWYTGAFNTPSEEVADYVDEAVAKPEWELPPDLLEAQTEPEVEESEPDADDGVSPIFLSTKARKSD